MPLGMVCQEGLKTTGSRSLHGKGKYLQEMSRHNVTYRQNAASVLQKKVNLSAISGASGVGPRNHVLDGHGHCYHLANMAKCLCMVAISGFATRVAIQPVPKIIYLTDYPLTPKEV